VIVAIAGSAALIAELDHALTGASPERRAQILKQMMDLFLSDSRCRGETHTDVFDEIFVWLIERLEVEMVARLGVVLSTADTTPRQALRRLAFHDDPSVAAPVLTGSLRLSETDLIEIANTRGPQHLLAIARRNNLDETLTDALIRRGNAEVSNALALNDVARFSECGYATLVGRAERDEGLMEKLGLRLDIPGSLLRELLASATDAVRARFLTAPRPLIRNKTKAPVEVVVIDPASLKEYRQAHQEMVALNRAGKLKDSTVNRFAVRGEYTNVVAALAFMSDVNIETIHPLFNSDRLYGLIVACKAARLNWSTTTMIIHNRPACPPATAHEFEQCLEIFQALSLSVAQWTIRYGADRIAAKSNKPLSTAVA
jgi:uncharacterized protein (DUF2336 family)